MMPRFFSLFIFLCSVYSSVSGTENYSVRSSSELKIHSLTDIPAKDINCIFNDRKGFMWIGTLDGLHRFDGYTYKTYRMDPSKNSISSNMVIAVDEDSKGNLWIGTYGYGLCKLDPVTDRFTSYEYSDSSSTFKIPEDITTFIVDDQDFIWIGNWFGLTRVQFDSTMNKVIRLDLFEFSLPESDPGRAVKSIFQDREKNIWVGTNLQVMRVRNPHGTVDEVSFDRFDCHTESICDFDDGVLVGGTEICSVVKEGEHYVRKTISSQSSLKVLYYDGKIWSGQRTGIVCLEPNSWGDWVVTRKLQKNFTEESLSSNITTALINDDLGQIWLGTRGGGVDVIKFIHNRFQHYKHSMNLGSVANDLVMCAFEDSNENLWLGTEEKGVSFLKKNRDYSKGFKHLMVNDFDNENRVYAIEETQTPNSAHHNSIIWTGTSHPKFLAAFNSQTLEEIPLNGQVDDVGHVFALENQDDSILWVGTYGSGLWRFNLDEEGHIVSKKNFKPQPKGTGSLLSLIVRSIFCDSNGSIWIGTDKGINRLQKSESYKEDPHFESFTKGDGIKKLSHNYVLQIMEARNGVFWIGTMGGGMLKYEESINGEFSFSSITTKDGLPNNTVKSIVEDLQGDLWLATNSGLSRYNPRDGNVINYDKYDGLQDNAFSEICGLRRRNGELVFGGINGFNVFRSENLKIDTVKPRLYFTDFLILNREVYRGDFIDHEQTLDKTIENTTSITLDYKHNSFSIGFVGIQFNSPHKNNYRYILEGFDKEWYKASPDYRMAKYTNVPDGEYIFKVMGSNSDNIWADEPIELAVTINPPGFRTPLAISMYLILIMGLIYIIFRVMSEIAQKRNDVLLAHLEKERLEDIVRLKLQFFTNISHEFRTPLSLISAPLEQLIAEGETCNNPHQQYNLKLIHHNVGVMMRLVNQLLDFRKLDQEKLRLYPSLQSLNAFLKSIFLAFEVMATQKRIKYVFIPVDGNDDVWIDVDKMEKVIYNLLSNAFKYTNENGSITLKVDADKEANQYIIRVLDSGVGIDPEEKKHIFERYYQNGYKKNRNVSGTGIGLALAKGFVDLHHGEIGFYPNMEQGTVFYVKLRMGNAQFNPDMFVETQNVNSLTIPQYQSPSPNKLEDELNENISTLPKMLVVEDNFDLRKQIKNIFRKQYCVYEAEDGLSGLKVCREKLPDIVVTDVMMPKMDGMELCKTIKTEEAISHIPVMILTAKNNDDTIVEGYELGADGYVAKPFSIEVLRARVNSLVKNREQLRARFQKEITINPKIISNTPADSKFLDKILSLIESHLSDSGYSVEQLAKDYGVSRIYLNRKIKALTGETTNEFMRNIRLKHATELLKQNKLNISEVAWEVGYNDIRTFRSRFKEKFEMSPSEFARQYK